MRRIGILLLPFLLTACSLFGVRSGYEQPGYAVIGQPGESLEIRRYEPRLAAEARVTAGGDEEGRNAAFRLLFDYITGANRDQAKISMTAPVETATADRSSKIAMTVPVESAEAGGGAMSMRFFLPAAFDAANAPRPTDPWVRLVSLPEATYAVLGFSGLRSEAKVRAKKRELLQALQGGRWQPAGEPVALFYDPPWTLPFFRRNEVAVPVARPAS